jgi:hypothetical protein
VTKELDDYRAAEGGEGIKVEEPMGAAGQEAVDEEKRWAFPSVDLEMKERIAAG